MAAAPPTKCGSAIVFSRDCSATRALYEIRERSIALLVGAPPTGTRAYIHCKRKLSAFVLPPRRTHSKFGKRHRKQSCNGRRKKWKGPRACNRVRRLFITLSGAQRHRRGASSQHCPIRRTAAPGRSRGSIIFRAAFQPSLEETFPFLLSSAFKGDTHALLGSARFGVEKRLGDRHCVGFPPLLIVLARRPLLNVSGVHLRSCVSFLFLFLSFLFLSSLERLASDESVRRCLRARPSSSKPSRLLVSPRRQPLPPYWTECSEQRRVIATVSPPHASA